MSKVEQAVKIVKHGMDQRFSIKTMKFEIQNKLEVSKPNANVYWHKACKRLDVRITNGE